MAVDTEYIQDVPCKLAALGSGVDDTVAVVVVAQSWFRTYTDLGLLNYLVAAAPDSDYDWPYIRIPHAVNSD